MCTYVCVCVCARMCVCMCVHVLVFMHMCACLCVRVISTTASVCGPDMLLTRTSFPGCLGKSDLVYLCPVIDTLDQSVSLRSLIWLVITIFYFWKDLLKILS